MTLFYTYTRNMCKSAKQYATEN